ncbi:ATP-binding protein [Aureimonas ureilytica]|nr:ATP-binding protein [Aureimonas ureilytica]
MTALPTKPHARSPDDRLAAEIARLLLPQRFPHRRDVELAGFAGEAPGGCAFYDVFWRPGGLLVLCAAKVRRDGVAGALRASALHRLLRAGLAVCADAVAGLALIEQAYAQEFRDLEFDLAIVTLDPASGGFSAAGRGRHVGSIGRETVCGRGSLPIGPVLWIAAGAEHLGPWAGDAPELGMDDLVQRHGPATEPGTALVGVILKAQARKAPHHFSMANDLSAIAGLVSSVEDVLGREGVPEPVGAALALVLDELLTNTVSYGFPDNGWHEILVGLDVAPGRIDLCVRDDGRAFDPLQVPEPELDAELEDRQVGGLGIHFVREVADEVSYERERGWNVLTVTKHFLLETGLSPHSDL